MPIRRICSMSSAVRPLFGALALLLSLAACGGGSSGSSSPVGPPTTTPPVVGGLTASPSTLAFAAPPTAAQTFTVSYSVPNATAPVINSTACQPVATISGGSSTLPSTYTVTPLAVGSCSIVITIDHNSTTIGITIGNPGSSGAINGPTGGLTFTLGGAPQTYTATVTGSSGPAPITFDATACAGIVTVTGSGGTSPQSFTATPVGVGTCSVTVISGSTSFAVPIVVNGATTSNGLIVSPQALSFASRSAGPQSFTLSFTGNVGTVSFDESSCTNPKIAFFTLQGSGSQSLPVTGTVQPYNIASGSCTIVFTPQFGTPATLAVTVSP
jgi:hypothetical protein